MQTIHKKPLIYNSDIKETTNLTLLQQKPQETYIQQTCKIIFERIALQNRERFNMDFLQIDNGGSQTKGGKFRKKAEGTIKGASDVQLWISCKKTKKVMIILCEFKRIGTPSQIDIKTEQVEFQKRWEMFYGCKCIFTNNPLYFEWFVCEILKTFECE